jgi:hypothetical protein
MAAMLQHVDQKLEDAELARRIAAASERIDEDAEAELCRRLAPRIRLYGLQAPAGTRTPRTTSRSRCS